VKSIIAAVTALVRWKRPPCSTCHGEGRVLRFYDHPGGPPDNGYIGCLHCKKGRAYDRAAKAGIARLLKQATLNTPWEMVSVLPIPFVALALAGCVTPPASPVTPTPTEITNNLTALTPANANPEGYFLSGVDLSTRRCSAWLDAETARNNQLSTESTTVGILGAAAGGVIGMAGGPPGAIAGTAIGTGAAQGVLGAQAAGSNITPATGMIIEQEQNLFLAASPVLTPGPAAGPMADVYVNSFAGKCTQRNAQLIQEQALMASQPVVIPTFPVSSPGPVVGSPTPIAPQPVMPTPVAPTPLPPSPLPPVVVPPAPSPGGPIFPLHRQSRVRSRAPHHIAAVQLDPRRFDQPVWRMALPTGSFVPPPVIAVRRAP
jgi:hypothetical protein